MGETEARKALRWEKKTAAFMDFTSRRAYLLLELLGKPQTAERKSWGNNPFWEGGIKGGVQNLSPCKLNSKGGEKNQLQFFPSASGSPDLKMVLRPDCCLTGRKKEVSSLQRGRASGPRTHAAAAARGPWRRRSQSGGRSASDLDSSRQAFYIEPL